MTRELNIQEISQAVAIRAITNCSESEANAFVAHLNSADKVDAAINLLLATGLSLAQVAEMMAMDTAGVLLNPCIQQLFAMGREDMSAE